MPRIRHLERLSNYDMGLSIHGGTPKTSKTAGVFEGKSEMFPSFEMDDLGVPQPGSACPCSSPPGRDDVVASDGFRWRVESPNVEWGTVGDK